jgi:hypothetical protein
MFNACKNAVAVGSKPVGPAGMCTSLKNKTTMSKKVSSLVKAKKPWGNDSSLGGGGHTKAGHVVAHGAQISVGEDETDVAAQHIHEGLELYIQKKSDRTRKKKLSFLPGCPASTYWRMHLRMRVFFPSNTSA